MKTANLIDRLNKITVGHTSLVEGVAVTRYSKAFELGTIDGGTVFRSVEETAAKLVELKARLDFEDFDAKHPLPSVRGKYTWETLPEEARQGWIAAA